MAALRVSIGAPARDEACESRINCALQESEGAAADAPVGVAVPGLRPPHDGAVSEGADDSTWFDGSELDELALEFSFNDNDTLHAEAASLESITRKLHVADNGRQTRVLPCTRMVPPRGPAARDNSARVAHAVSAVAVLNAWMEAPAHTEKPYPTHAEVAALATAARLTPKQVYGWFANKRRRVWKVRLCGHAL